MERVNLGVVGMGIGKALARAFAADPRGRVAALCDLDEGRMAELAADLPEPPRRFTRFEELLADGEVDAVFIGTPNQLHAPQAVAALESGKHVLCVKPLADSETAARELVRIAEGSGRVNMMALSMRYGAPAQHLGRLSRRGDLGEVYYARARSVRRSGIPDWGAHFIQAGGGAFRDMGVHVLDAAWWMMGCPEPVTALGTAGAKFGPRGRGYWQFHEVDPRYSALYAADDYGAGLVRFANGAAIQVESFWASHQPDEVQIELFGTEGGARLDPLTLYQTRDGRPADTTIAVESVDGFKNVSARFIACILDGAPCQSPLRHGLTVQRMLEAVLASAETGREVLLAPD